MKKQWIVYCITILLAVVLVGCAGGTEGSPAGSEDKNRDITTEAYAPPAERGTKTQALAHKKVQDLERPASILYVVDGAARCYLPEDEAYQRILELNELRDQQRDNAHYESGAEIPGTREELYLTFGTQDYQTGRYLIYRYDTGSYCDVVFSLVTAEETKSGPEVPWMLEEGEGSSGAACTGLNPADDLIAYIKTK